ncbi:MAG: DNA cytosine methyltransferase, partial [Acidimicrobiales bacterium]
GVGGSTKGLESAGVRVRVAANHKVIAIESHGANFPRVDHVRADLSDSGSRDYIDPESFPPVRVVWASPSCRAHSQANAKKYYSRGPAAFRSDAQGLLFDPAEDGAHDAYANSERSRLTMVCPLRYAAKHHPEIVMIENVAEAALWGPNRDGSTFQWWLGEWAKIGYEHEILFFNSMFFPPCPQSRDRMYIVFWRKGNPQPDLDYRPRALCVSDACGGAMVDAVQTWKPRTAAWPLARWGKYRSQYIYTCPDCAAEVMPVTWPAYDAIDWSDPGPSLSERADLGMRPLKPATMERIRRAVAKYQHGPAVVIPAKAEWGTDRPVHLPLSSKTSEQEKALAVFGAVLPAAGNTSERSGQTRARGLSQPLFTQTATMEFGFAHLPATAVFRGGEASHIAASAHGVGDVLKTVTAGGFHHGLVSRALFTKINGGPDDTIWHLVTDPLNTITGRDTHGLVILPWLGEWRRDPAGMPELVARELAAARGALAAIEPGEMLSDAELADVRFRMLRPMPELRRGMAFPDDYIVLGSQEQQTDLLGNAVTPPVAAWITERCVATLRGTRAAA